MSHAEIRFIRLAAVGAALGVMLVFVGLIGVTLILEVVIDFLPAIIALASFAVSSLVAAKVVTRRLSR